MIRIYSREGCPYCDKAKALVKRHGYDYEELDIDHNEEALKFFISENHRTVPQIYIGNQLLVTGGYDGLSRLTTKQIALRIREINER